MISPAPAWAAMLPAASVTMIPSWPWRKLVEIHLGGERKRLPAGVSRLRQVCRADWNESADGSHYFHRMAVIRVPLPGLVSISNSFISRLLPPRPRPMPEPVVYPSLSATATSGMPGP